MIEHPEARNQTLHVAKRDRRLSQYRAAERSPTPKGDLKMKTAKKLKKILKELDKLAFALEGRGLHDQAHTIDAAAGQLDDLANDLSDI